MANEFGDADWTDLSRFNVRFDEAGQEKKLYANGNMQLKIVVEILAKDKNGDPVSLSENQLLYLRLVDADKENSTELGNGWNFTTEENKFSHSLSSAPSYYYGAGDNSSDRQFQTRVLWVTTSQTGTKKIGATIMSTTSLKTFSSMATSESTVICEGIPAINYTPGSLKCEEEELASRKYIDYSILVIDQRDPDPRRIEKEWKHSNVYIKPVSGLRLILASYHFEAADGRKLELAQLPMELLTPTEELDATGGYDNQNVERGKDVYGRETGGKFPLIPLKYDQHDNDLHVFDLWYFLAPKEFRDDRDIPADFIASYQGPATVGTDASYRRPFGIHFSGSDEEDIDYEYRDHTLYTTAEITGNGQAGAICVSHVNFKHTNSAQAYKDINYLRENKVWIEFIDEFGNRGAFGLLIQDDQVKLTSHLLT